MTNQRAIFELIRYRRRLEENYMIDAEPFDMAIEALEENESLAKSVNDAAELIRKLQKKNEWIPCSERLPEEAGVYPVVINGTDPVLSVKYEQGFAMGYYAPIDEAWEIDGHEELIHDLEVLAWFELPPYEENES